MIKAEVIVRGRVQKVGYRDYVQEVARRLGVKGYVENLRDGSVKIICEAEEQTLQEFLKQINVEKDLIMVKGVEVVKTEPATYQYWYFDIKYGSLEEELDERLVALFNVAMAIRHDIKSTHQDLKSSIESCTRAPGHE